VAFYAFWFHRNPFLSLKQGELAECDILKESQISDLRLVTYDVILVLSKLLEYLILIQLIRSESNVAHYSFLIMT